VPSNWANNCAVGHDGYAVIFPYTDLTLTVTVCIVFILWLVDIAGALYAFLTAITGDLIEGFTGCLMNCFNGIVRGD